MCMFLDQNLVDSFGHICKLYQLRLISSLYQRLHCIVSTIKMLAYCKAALQVLSWQIDGRPKGPRLVWKLSDVSGAGDE